MIKFPLGDNEATVTRRVLSDLNDLYNSAFNRSFTESLLKHCDTSEGIAVKQTRTVQKKIQRNICSSINKSFGETMQ